METPLNISLEAVGKTSYYSNKMKKTFLFVLLAFLLVWGIFRLYITRDTVSANRPSESVLSIRLLKNAPNTEILHDHLGSNAVIFGSSLRFDDIIASSNREFAIHLDLDGNIIGVSFDSKITPAIQTELESNDIKITEYKKTTVITRASTTINQSRTIFHPLRALLPWYDGDCIVSGSISHLISLTKKRLKIVGAGYKPTARFSEQIPENADIHAYFYIASTGLPDLTNILPVHSGISQTLFSFFSDNGLIFLGHDYQGQIFSLITPTADIKVQDLAKLQQELLKQFNLSTTALTMEDNTTIQEIRSNTDSFVSSISTDDNTQFITASDTQGNTIYLTKTDSIIVLSNRESPLITRKNLISSCSASAHSILFPKQLVPRYTNITTNQLPIFFSMSEIAITNSDLLFCW